MKRESSESLTQVRVVSAEVAGENEVWVRDLSGDGDQREGASRVTVGIRDSGEQKRGVPGRVLPRHQLCEQAAGLIATSGADVQLDQ